MDKKISTYTSKNSSSSIENAETTQGEGKRPSKWNSFLRIAAISFAFASCGGWLGILNAITRHGYFYRYIYESGSAIIVVVLSLMAIKYSRQSGVGLVVISVLWLVFAPSNFETARSTSIQTLLSGICFLFVAQRKKVDSKKLDD